MKFRHLTYENREQIEFLLKKGASQSTIARKLEVNRSTINKEIDRNSFCDTYTASYAQYKAMKRKQRGSYKPAVKEKRTVPFRNKVNYLNSRIDIPLSELMRERNDDRKYRKRPTHPLIRIFNRRRRKYHAEAFQLQEKEISWRRRKRRYILEAIRRTKRFGEIWLRYNYSPLRKLHLTAANSCMTRYNKQGRTFFGKKPCRFYRVNPFTSDTMCLFACLRTISKKRRARYRFRKNRKEVVMPLDIIYIGNRHRYSVKRRFRFYRKGLSDKPNNTAETPPSGKALIPCKRTVHCRTTSNKSTSDKKLRRKRLKDKIRTKTSYKPQHVKGTLKSVLNTLHGYSFAVCKVPAKGWISLCANEPVSLQYFYPSGLKKP